SLAAFQDDVTYSKNLQEYLLFVSRVVQQARRVLKDSGNLFIHVEPTLSSYIRLILDQVFGKEHFRQEIVLPGLRIRTARKLPASGHHAIFHYSKTNSYMYNPPRRSRSDRDVGPHTKRDD